MKDENHPRHGDQRRVRQNIRPEFLLFTILMILCLGAIYWIIKNAFWPEAEMEPSIVEGPKTSIVLPQNNQTVVETDNETDNEADNMEAPWYLTLVNRWNTLPENYEVNLVDVPGGEQVDERIYDPLMEMLEAAKEENWDQLPSVVSGYRTQEKQQSLYDDKIEEFCEQGYSPEEATDMAKQWVAVPGYSEHQLGFAVDINGATYDLYFWLQENSYKYGFIFRYPGDKTDITGTAEEVWHYRYVGKEAAKEIHDQGICLEEYLDNVKEASLNQPNMVK